MEGLAVVLVLLGLLLLALMVIGLVKPGWVKAGSRSKVILFYGGGALVALLACGGVMPEKADSHMDLASGIHVSGKVGQGKWPLKDINEGRIVCFGLSRSLPTEPPYFVFFEAPTGDLYALNGKARQEVDSGRIQGGIIDEIMVHEGPVGAYLVSSEWTSAGVALCKGDMEEARRLAAKSNEMTQE